MKGNTKSVDIRENMKLIKRSSTYLVRLVYDGKDGLIGKIEISIYD